MTAKRAFGKQSPITGGDCFTTRRLRLAARNNDNN
jgi:hypothetical protein